MGGSIHVIHKIEDALEIVDLGLDDDTPSEGAKETHLFKSSGDPLYVLVIKAEALLKNGFRYIKELLLQHHNHKLKQAWNTLTQNNINIYSVKTDCFTIRASDLERALTLLPFDQGHGTWRVSKMDDINYPYEKLTIRQARSFSYSNLKTTEIKIKDEWNTEELCEIFEKHRRVMVRAEYAGCGKSFACKAMEKRGHKVLFVCPTNKLAQNNNEHGITLHNFFGIGMHADRMVSKFDASGYDVIVFDEIYFANIRMLVRIRNYCLANPDKIIVATGDTNQLECIDLIANNIDYDEYMTHCIDTIFPYNLTLKENKRLKSKKDRKTLIDFKRDCFDESIPLVEVVKRYFRQTDEITTTNNIAYMNSTCERVAKEVREKLGKKGPYEVGEKLVCRKFVKEGKHKFKVNFEFTISKVTPHDLTLKDESTDEEMEIGRNTADRYFIHSYCRTCHSFQGSSIDDQITILDWRFKFVNRKWLYTAVTRATELKNVMFYSGRTANHTMQDERQLDRYLIAKVAHYRKQDRDAGRKIRIESYLTPEWLKAQYGKNCSGCGDCLTFEIKGIQVLSNLTADRFDNGLDHSLDNIVPLCCSCNQRKAGW